MDSITGILQAFETIPIEVLEALILTGFFVVGMVLLLACIVCRYWTGN
jgi:hypothetical protein